MVSVMDGWIRPLADPSENVKLYYNILVALVFFFVAQLLICAWDQPFWVAGLDFPGQIIAMVFVWLAVWAVQVIFCEPGEGIDKFYHKFLRTPVSREIFCLFAPLILRGTYVLTSDLDRWRFSTSTCPLALRYHS